MQSRWAVLAHKQMQMDVWMDGWVGGRTDRQTDRQTAGEMHK